MYEVAEQVSQWLDEGREVRIATVVASTGVSSRDESAATAWTGDRPPVGALIEGLALDPPDELGCAVLPVSEALAATAGLSCGGSVTVLTLSAGVLPGELWERLRSREPVCLVVELARHGEAGIGPARLFTPADMHGADGLGADVPRLFARGTSATAIVESDDTRQAVVALWPVPRLVVVGDGLIADALVGAAALLGWHSSVIPDVDEAVAAAGDLRGSDSIVVLSHDRDVDGPALAAALGGTVGYVGALGSRRTQAARRDWLLAQGVADAAIGRIHGPAGLDIDAHTPGEIAVSIVAEILANRSQSGGGALRDRSGPVHLAGVNAPPPRYAPGS